MAFVKTIPPRDADGDVRRMYERQQAKFGYVPNYAKVFSHRPDIMQYWADLQAGIRRHIDKRRFELVTFAAALALRSSYCSLAHGRALSEHFSQDDVRRLAEGADFGVLTDAEAAMVVLARKVAADASAVTAGDVARLKENGLTDAEIFDIVATAAARAFFAKLLDGLGTEADADYLAMDEPLRNTLTPGRPIAFAAPECLTSNEPAHSKQGTQT